MGVVRWLRGLFGGGAGSGRGPGFRRDIRGRYDSAVTTDDNANLWIMTDYLSATAANSYHVRRTLKIRSRYIRDNSSYLAGMVDTLADDLVGTGPRLQSRGVNRKLNQSLEKAWQEWCLATSFAEHCTVAHKAFVVDGEGFALHISNPLIDYYDTPIQFDLQDVESDQVMTPDPGYVDKFWVDGVVLNEQGNPVQYHVLKHHPGDLFIPQLNPLEYLKWKPAQIRHWFVKNRPGQVRGVPRITPSMELWAKMKRFGDATLTAAEAAANLGAVLLKTNAAANYSDTVEGEPWDVQDLDKGMMTVLPAGYEAQQMTPAHPSTTYEMFQWLIAREAARCLHIPLSKAIGDSSRYNFASGRLDHLGYYRHARNQRFSFSIKYIEPAFKDWYKEARLVHPDLKSLPPRPEPHRWIFDPFESIDPVQDAQAATMLLAAHLTSLEDQLAERGEDLDDHLEQLAKEAAALKAAGLEPVQSKEAPGRDPGKQAAASHNGNGRALHV